MRPSRGRAPRRRSGDRGGRGGSPRPALPSLSHDSSPDAWKVATSGHLASASVATQGVGVIGSCRWSRSKRSVSSTRLIRKIERGLRMMFGSDPFAGTITDRPIGITSGGGSSWRPSRGWRTRVKLPGGSLPITSRTSCPSLRSAAAWSSACSTTAPQNDHEYGTTIPTFISHKYSCPATFCARMTFVRLAPLALVALLAASCGDNDKKSATPATTAAATTTRRARLRPARAPRRRFRRRPPSKGNRLLLGVGERDLYPLLAASLSRYTPNQVRGKSVNIVQVEGTDGFWAGRSAKQRILVKLNLKGGKPPKLEAGQRADFVGQLMSAQGKNPILLGVKEKSGQRVLQKQGVYILVSDRRPEAALAWPGRSASSPARCWPLRRSPAESRCSRGTATRRRRAPHPREFAGRRPCCEPSASSPPVFRRAGV